MKKIIATMLTFAVVVLGIVAFSGPAQAAPECQIGSYNVIVHHPAVTHEETVIVTDVPAYDETVIDVPAWDETVVDQPAYDDPDLWWNWSPNKDQGPFEGPPAFPVDERGTWQGPHENGGPSQDTYGTFQQGEGHGSWFHREHGVHHDAVTHVVHHDAVTHIVHHDAVTHTEVKTVVDTPAYVTSKTFHTKVCKDSPNKPEKHVTVTNDHAQAPIAVPTVVESGLATLDKAEPAAQTSDPAGLFVLIGVALLGLGYVALRRSKQ